MLVPDEIPQKFNQRAFGEAIGIIIYRKWYPALILGHHNYAATYDFPIRIKFINNWVAPKGKEEEWAGWNLAEYIKCAKELEEEGVAAITTNCGMTGSIQEELSNAVDIPVFTSNLMQVPFVSRMIGKKKKVGVLTASETRARSHNYRMLRRCGIDESIPVAIKGMEESEYAHIWLTQTRPDFGTYDPKKVEAIMVATAKTLISENPDIGAIVLECTEMPLYAAAIREATGLLVFDSSSLVKYVYDCIVKTRYF